MARIVSLSAYILSTVSPSCKHQVKKIQPTAHAMSCIVAERVGFEPTVGCPITSFQDWLLKPLGHLSGYRKTAETAVICGGVRGI